MAAYPKRDLPYYNGEPVEISGVGWLAVVASVAVGFALLIALPLPSFPFNIIPAIVFTGLPLLTLAAVTGGKHTALFGRFGFKEFGLALGFGILTILASLAVGLILLQFISMNANPSIKELANIGGVDLVGFLIRTFIQLIGEELLTILPLLAVLWLCVRKFNLPRRTGLVIAVILSTLIFAALHLPTYNWNLVQCIGGIGTARLVLTAAFLLTRNLWVSAGAHIANDWSEFFAPMVISGFATHDPIGTGM